MEVVVLMFVWVGSAAVVGVVTQAVVNRRMRRPLRWTSQSAPRCRGCGYDLRGAPAAGCPECGRGRQ